VQGLFGVGGERSGVLRVLEGPAEPAGLAGSIVAMDAAPTARWLRAAAEAGVRGVVCPTMDDGELAGLLGYEIGVAITGDEACGLTVVLTEGFGSMRVAPRTWSLLRALAGRRALISGATQVRAGVIRPELLVPHDGGAGLPAAEAAEAAERVRLLRAPYLGAAGRVVGAPVEPQPIPTGARVRVFRVRLDDGREVTVPRANVEVLD